MCRGWNHILEEAGREVDSILQMEWWSRLTVILLVVVVVDSPHCVFGVLCWNHLNPQICINMSYFQNIRKIWCYLKRQLTLKTGLENRCLINSLVPRQKLTGQLPDFPAGGSWSQVAASGGRLQPLTIGRRYRTGGGINCHLRKFKVDLSWVKMI